MSFGDGLRPAADATSPAEWIGGARGSDWGSVGGLVPNDYESVLRVFPPAPCDGDWWSLYCDLFRTVAAVGERHTSTPDRGWFAIWEGHGFDQGALDRVPLLDLPHRSYYLVQGAITAVTALRYPMVSGWRNPDLFWPDDRRWFVATDVDFWSLYIGGDDRFITELAGSASTTAEPVALNDVLEIED